MERRVLKLNRIASLLRPAVILCAGVFWLFFVIIGAIEAKGDAGMFAFYAIEGLSLPLIIFLCIAFLNTRKVAIDKDFMEFIYYQSAPSNNMSRRSRRVRVKYTVTEIENLCFEQNALEKLFNCGHFSFKGNTVYESNSKGFEPKTEFTFYGLTHFRQTKKEICDILGVNEIE
ncbi:MAG: hypothetical protein J6S71_06805 [Clostridia bacterium]|nr:hypothetical protein [Clostridia bacterium]